jgi:transposase InsO family protein
VSSAYLDRLLLAAAKRRGLDSLALRAVMKATHLLGLALAERLREYRDHGDPVLDRLSRLQEDALHVGLIQETVQVLGRRWDKLPERQRTHYSPQDRFRILRIRTLLALSAEEAALMFRVSTGTVLRWEAEVTAAPERETVGSLLDPVPPVRRFADVVRHVVHSLTLAGFPGDGSLAAHPARAAWKLSRRTVQRIRRERVVPAPEPAGPPNATPRAVRARYPHHVWMLDVTEIPGLFRLFCFKLAVVFDVFSRAPLSAAVFLSEPDASAIAKLLRSAARRFGPPRHLVTDRGAQFTAELFRRTVTALGIRHRFGAVGKTGSIALIERFFRTLQDTMAVRLRPPLLLDDLVARLEVVLAYYCWLRPHSALANDAPAERLATDRVSGPDPLPAVTTGLPVPVSPLPVSPPRGRRGEHIPVVVPFELRYVSVAAVVRLPYLVRKAA